MALRPSKCECSALRAGGVRCHGHVPYIVPYRFTPTQLVDGLLAKSHLLSLVIDFTNTARYYDPKVSQDTALCIVLMWHEGIH